MEDRLIGSWKLKNAWHQQLFGRDYFTTGYEIGIFNLTESGEAIYSSSTDTLKGFWESDRHIQGYYNSNGDWENRSMKYLRIDLVNFQQNRRILWEFDDFSFRNDWNNIRAEQYSLSNDRVYEFERQQKIIIHFVSFQIVLYLYQTIMQRFSKY